MHEYHSLFSYLFPLLYENANGIIKIQQTDIIIIVCMFFCTFDHMLASFCTQHFALINNVIFYCEKKNKT